MHKDTGCGRFVSTVAASSVHKTSDGVLVCNENLRARTFVVRRIKTQLVFETRMRIQSFVQSTPKPYCIQYQLKSIKPQEASASVRISPTHLYMYRTTGPHHCARSFKPFAIFNVATKLSRRHVFVYNALWQEHGHAMALTPAQLDRIEGNHTSCIRLLLY